MNEEDKVLLLFKWSAYRNQVREYLREQGYSKIWGVEDPKEAINEVRSFQPNLVLIDKNYEGYQGIARIIRARTSEKNLTIKAIDAERISIEESIKDTLTKRLQEAETV